MKYILKESELKSMLEDIIKEELNEGFLGNIGRGLWNTAKHTALGAAEAVVNPGKGFGKIFQNTNDVLSGNKSLGQAIGWNTQGKEDRTSQVLKKKKEERAEKKENARLGAGRIETEYGQPLMAANGKRLENKQPMVAENFLDSGQEVNLGMHYLEDNQNGANSYYKLFLNKLKNNYDIVRASPKRLDSYRKVLEKWLDKRDKAYEEYVKLGKQLKKR